MLLIHDLNDCRKESRGSRMSLIRFRNLGMKVVAQDGLKVLRIVVEVGFGQKVRKIGAAVQMRLGHCAYAT